MFRRRLFFSRDLSKRILGLVVDVNGAHFRKRPFFVAEKSLSFFVIFFCYEFV